MIDLVPIPNDDPRKPYKLTPEIRQKILEAAALGYDRKQTAAHAGISRQTPYSWLEKQVDLAQEYERACLDPIRKAKTTVIHKLDDPKLAQWYLKNYDKHKRGDEEDEPFRKDPFTDDEGNLIVSRQTTEFMGAQWEPLNASGATPPETPVVPNVPTPTISAPTTETAAEPAVLEINVSEVVKVTDTVGLTRVLPRLKATAPAPLW